MSYDFSLKAPVEAPNYERNLTYNVGPMLKRAGFHPRVVNGMTAKELFPIVENARQVLAENEAYFLQFEPSNGWGSWEGTVMFLSELESHLMDCPSDWVFEVH